MREALEPGAAARLFEPFPAPLARALERALADALADGPDAAGDPHAGYPWRAANARWLALHQKIAATARDARQAASGALEGTTRAAAPAPANAVRSPAPEAAAAQEPPRAVDVCIPYYNLGAYLPALLEALDQQTTQDFNLFVVNDGSPDPRAVAVFERMAAAYARHAHWRFVTTTNQGVCAARNLAASLGTAEYLSFVDADNLPLPTMIERFLASIRQSGDDVLTCYLYAVEREGDFKPGLDLRRAPLAHYLPVGNCLPLGVFTNPFGDINCIMRRAAFEAVGGFTTDVTNAINHEDRELLTRLAFGGYRLDVIPEFLCYYRQRASSRLRTTNQYLNDARVMRVYLEHLRQAGQPELAPLAPFALGLLHGDDPYGAPPADTNWLHFLTFEVSAVTLARALARRLRHHLRARLNRTHQPR
jgi:glycosyltransferase involved in cell wall biosynthesis